MGNLSMLEKSLYIGISIHLDDKGVNNIFANGAIQNIIFMYLLYQKLPFVRKVSLVYLGNRDTPHPNLKLDGLDICFEHLDRVVGELDLLIEGTVMLEPRHSDAVHANNGKVVSYRMGNDYILEMESFLFDANRGRFFNGTTIDEVWTIPQFENSCKSYFGIMNRAPVKILPHLWSPMFFDDSIKELASHNVRFGYKPNLNKAKRISVFEPNISVVKTCYIPILICEQTYRTDKNLIEHVYLCNTFDKKDRNTFHNFIGRTDLVKDNVMTVEGRYLISDFLSRYTDIVVTHHWENGLNYAYYEALYGGYALVHNSKLMPVGYYYSEFDAEDGAKVLIDVIKNHDQNYAAYVDQANQYLQTLSMDYSDNINAYADAIVNLFNS